MSESEGFESRKRRSLRTQPKTQHPDPLTCPRCDSTNTKFCYYNNYNKTQPRYFCKACKRHWTKGGLLRNVPVGGDRKNKRLRRPVVMTATTAMAVVDQDNLLPRLNDPKETLYDHESYTNIEELKGLVSWDFDTNPSSTIPRSSFIKMFENDDEDDDLSSATSMIISSCSQQTSDLSWNDLDTMVLEDLNTLWEDPTFKT